MTALGLVQGVDWNYDGIVVSGYEFDPALTVKNPNWQAGRVGNISSNPLFVNFTTPWTNPWIGFSLQYSSPAYKTASDGTNIGAWQGDLTPPDTTAPVITLLGTSPITVAVGSTYTDAGATALDNIDGNLTLSIAVTNPVNTSAVGSYTVTYNVSDAAGILRIL